MSDVPSPTPPELEPTEPTEVCAVSGKRYPRRQMIQYEGKWIAAENKDAYFQRLREGVSPTPARRYGGFWIRFGAKLIDSIVLGVVNMALTATLMPLFFSRQYHPFQRAQDLQNQGLMKFLLFELALMTFGLTIQLLYQCILVRRYDATLGKLACGLRLLRPDGSKLGVWRIIGRVFAEWVSALIFCIGYMMAGWDDEKRSLHDRICDTRVFKAS